MNILGTAANDTLTFAPADGTGSFTSSQSPSLSFQADLNVERHGRRGRHRRGSSHLHRGWRFHFDRRQCGHPRGRWLGLPAGAGIDELHITTLGGGDDVALTGIDGGHVMSIWALATTWHVHRDTIG